MLHNDKGQYPFIIVCALCHSELNDSDVHFLPPLSHMNSELYRVKPHAHWGRDIVLFAFDSLKLAWSLSSHGWKYLMDERKHEGGKEKE